MSTTVLLLAAPLAWSAAVALLRRLAARGQVLRDTAEKVLLGLLLLPFVAGLAIHYMPVPVPALAALPLPALGGDDGGTSTTAVAALPHVDVWRYIPKAVLAVWAAGAAVAMGRHHQTIVRVARIAHKAQPVEDGVRTTPVSVPAFAWHGAIVVPVQLRDTLPPAQLRLIVAHEKAHVRRNDPLWFLLFGLIDAALWFDPFVTAQTRACRLAAELACDDAAVAGGDRKAYALALLAALKLPHAGAEVVPAMSGKDSYGLRLDRIMTRRPAPKAVAWLCVAVALAVPATLAQLAFAKSPPAPLVTILQDAALAAPASTAAFAIPVDGQIGDGFGVRMTPPPGSPKFHEGLDFIAPMGTPVRASAAGTITFVGDRPGYGTVIEIDHAGGIHTRYAHLSRTDVKAGDTVSQNQAIGAVGSTGKSTQPHLHFEIWQDGKPQDPKPLLGLAD